MKKLGKGGYKKSLFFGVLFFTLHLFSQTTTESYTDGDITLSGPTNILLNTSYSYNIGDAVYNGWVASADIEWTITGGDIVDNGTNINTTNDYFEDYYGQEMANINIIWRATGLKRVHAIFIDYFGQTMYQLAIDITEPPNNGTTILNINENYIYTVTPTVATTNVTSLNNSEKIENITYFDGLGRPIQQIGIRQSASQKDIVTHMTYDDLGRQSKQYLPYASLSNDGSYRTDALIKTNAYYNTNEFQNTINPYSETLFEESPLNLPIEIAAPGNDWKEGINNEHTIKNEYKLVENSDNVHVLEANHTVSGNLNLVMKGMYTVSYQTNQVGDQYAKTPTLHKFITKNENWKASDGKNNTEEVFKDYRGITVLKRSYNNGIAHDTYNVYDKYGNLLIVIPPKVTLNNGVSATELSELCYQYRYDVKNRLVEKKIPGKGWEYIVYDKVNRPILTQDAVQRAKSNKEWLFTKYDAYGRTIYSGLYKDNRSRINVQNSANSSNSVIESITTGSGLYYYTNNAYPINVPWYDVYTINYYDDYVYWGGDTHNPQTNYYGKALTNNTKGLSTTSKEFILGGHGWITTITGYDEKARPIYIWTKNDYLNTTDIVESKLDDFTGKVLEIRTTHKKVGKSDIIITDKFTYDHLDRLLTQTQKINSQAEELIVNNEYKELGELKSKKVGGAVESQVENSNGLQTIDYKYNVRGWLTNINDVDNIGSDLFTFKINYNTKNIQTTSVYTPLYDGNISETIWRTKSDYKKRGYQYSYDDLSRITYANYREENNLLSGSGKFETSYNYDKNGNLDELIRTGAIGNDIDELSYDYSVSSNKLVEVEDASGNTDGLHSTTQYDYDSHNGNLISDSSKGITSIEYNHLNLPTKVHFGSSKRIEYIYSATGSKLQKKVINNGTSTTNYAGSFIYENNVLKHFSHPEGYVEVNGSSYTYIYQYTDHLGNSRLNYTNIGSSSSPNLQIREENNYYPFGMKMTGFNTNIIGVQDDYKYNGKEYQDEVINGKKLDWYDYGARNYEPSIGRWHVIDAMAEKRPDLTPFRYGFNNPINVIDPDGNFEKDDFWGGGGGFTSVTVRGLQDGGTFTFASSGSTTKNNSGCPKCKTFQDYINYYLGLNGSKNEEDLEEAIASGDEDRIDKANSDFLQNEANFEQAVRTAQETAKFIADYDPFGFANAYYQFTMGDSNINKGMAVLAFLPVGKIGKGFQLLSKGRVFWSGGSQARVAAETFARANGFKTLEMTFTGKFLTKMTKLTSYEFTKPLWNFASQRFARGANGTINVFQNANTGIRLESVWRLKEYPILKNKNIIYHNILK
ncbi:DUF6443 domain-containing protein [Polaribacter porphyrae]|uniref:DUF6443 domain-containing protein n=1 Tax=Polaribacter porphyrae TaxID=1137780 RepID=A0A2S7WN77_9FLAO|nr:DUF6443 domain-containing protein [Polaribacter porphyrae]PQJ78762.1 hypothetical protein BTO18_05990 [Polaribacter porphyrae]